MRLLRNRYWAILPVSIFAVSGVVAKVDQARAQRAGQVVGAGAAGLALGLIIGGMANQGQANPSPERGTPDRRTYPKSTNRSVNQSAYSAQGKAEIERIQEALNLLGYDAGTVDGSMGPQTLKAVSKFRSENGLPQNGLLSTAEQKILFAEVEKRKTVAPPTPRTPVVEPERPKPDPRLELAHWETVRGSKVAAELEDYISRYPAGEFTNLAILRLQQIRQAEDERRPRLELPREGSGQGPVLPVIDDATFPKAKQRRPDAVAVIIGNSAYGNDVPRVEYAVRDAEAIKLMAMKTLGIDSQNVIFLTDASRAAMDKVFGTDRDHKGHLWRLIDPDGRSDVFVFFSGHGVPGINDAQDNFLLPVDGDPNLANINGYPLSQLYRNLGELKTKSTTVFLDACFSGQAPDAAGTPLIKHASPVFITKATPTGPSKINVFAAAAERQLSSWDTAAGHGLFTRYVLLGLSGEADDNKNSVVTAKELSDYVHRQVRRAARLSHGREQEPRFSGDPDFVISNF